MTKAASNVHLARIASKTISLKHEAYDRLRAARRYPTESFIEVIPRATWPGDTITGRGLLSLLKSAPPWFHDLRAAGQLVGPNDLWIAATALAYEKPVVTRNVEHFTRVAHLEVDT